MTLQEVATELSRRLTRIFLTDADGRRPVAGGVERFQSDPHWRDYVLFHEYFHGDNGAGLGASHQTGWTGLVAKLLQQSGPKAARRRKGANVAVGTGASQGTQARRFQCPDSSCSSSMPARATAAGRSRRTRARCRARSIARSATATGRREFELYGSGRTDAGVHALAQVAHLDVYTTLAPELLRRKINDELPADIHIRAIDKAPHRFHARHDARSRSYLYQISRRRTAFAKPFVWWIREPLDVVRDARGAQAASSA